MMLCSRYWRRIALHRSIQGNLEIPQCKIVSPDEDFGISALVMQVDALAPFMRVIVLDYALRKAINGQKVELKLNTLIDKRGQKHPTVSIYNLDFADDIVLSFQTDRASKQAASQC